MARYNGISPHEEFDMIATTHAKNRHFSALFPLLGTASAFLALLSVGFAIGGTVAMSMM
jgi:hypothetical protein